MRMMMTGAALAGLMLAACQPANEQKPGDHAPPTPQQTVAAPAEKPVYRFKIGALDAIALFDGENPVPNDNKVFGVGHTPAEVASLLTQAGLPTDRLELSLQPLLVKTAERVMLFDTGAGANFGPSAGRLLQSMAETGFAPVTVTDIFISHSHGDHVGGLVNASGALNFPNAATFGVIAAISASCWPTPEAFARSGDMPLRKAHSGAEM